jgi:hypothetical protein
MTRKTRVAAALGVGSLLVVVALLTVAGRPLLTHYHLYRLENSPVYFLSMLARPSESAAAEALRQFTRTDAGARSLFVEYLDRCFASSIDLHFDALMRARLRNFKDGERFVIRVDENEKLHLLAEYGGGLVGTARSEEISALQDVLCRAGATNLAHPDFPNVRFAFGSVKFNVDSPQPKCVCSVRRSTEIQR